MPVFVVVVKRGANTVQERIAELPKKSVRVLTDDAWLIDFDGTTKECAEGIGIRGEEADVLVLRLLFPITLGASHRRMGAAPPPYDQGRYLMATTGRTPPRQPEPETTDTDFETDDPRRSSRTTDIILAEIAKLQSDAEYTKRDLGEFRADMRDVKDRLARLEVRVDHLPSKGFIVGAVVIALTVVSGLLAIAPKLQGFAGTALTVIAPQPSLVR